MTNDDVATQMAELLRRVEALEQRRVVQAERVDIVEPDGSVRLVISNSDRSPDPVCDGQTFKRDGGRPAGLPAIGGATRLFVGKTRERAAVVELRDGAGHVCLRLSVTHDGTPRLEFLDADGVVTASLPD
jgi:hypothetical protein